MKKLLIVPMVIYLVVGCTPIIPEEWLPLVGEWDLLKTTEHGIYEGRLYFNAYGEINFGDLECDGLSGKDGDYWIDNYFCTLTDNNAAAEFSPDQYQYYAVVYTYSSEYPEYSFEFDYYFNIVDNNSIEGVYANVPSIVPPVPIVLPYMPFSGTRKQS